MTEHYGTFGLTGVEIEEKKQAPPQPEIKEKLPRPRQRVNSQEQLVKPRIKPKIQNLPSINPHKPSFRIRSHSTQNVQKLNKVDQLKQIIDTNKPQVVGKTKEFALPKTSKSFLDIYHNKIQSEYDQLYNTCDYLQILNKIKNIEKKQVMLEQIDKNHTFLQKEMNLFNQIETEYKNKLKRFESITLKLSQIEAQLQMPSNFDNYVELTQYYKRLQEEYGEVTYEQQTLQFMNQNRNDELFFNDQLDEELSEFENKKAIEEIFRHEEKQRQDRERAKRKERIVEEKRIRQENESKYKEILREMKQVERQLNHEHQKFEQLKQVTQVNSIENLISHKQYLQDGQKNLNNMKKEYIKDIEKNKKIIAEFEIKRKKLLYEQSAETDEESMLQKISKLEQINNQVQEKQRDVQKNVQKKRNSIDKMCLLVSRVLYQLQSKKEKIKNFEVKRGDLPEMVNVSSLMLERINGLLQKNQGDYVKIESVNTDTTHENPPQFLGLSKKKTLTFKNTMYNNDSNDSYNLDSPGVNYDSQDVSQIRNQVKQENQQRILIENLKNSKKEKK